MSKSQVRPLCEADRAELIEMANQEFETVLKRIGEQNPEAVRKLWDAKSYVDELFKSEMSHYNAINQIDCFLVHDVIALATRANSDHVSAD